MNKLNKLKELHVNTTQGKWEWKCSYVFHNHEHKGFDTECENVAEGRMHLSSGDEVVLSEWIEYASDSGIAVSQADAVFIAEAHKMVPRLIEALEKAIEQRNDELQQNNAWALDLAIEQILEGKK